MDVAPWCDKWKWISPGGDGWQMLRSPKGLLRKEGPPTYAILSRNLILSRFTRFFKGFRRALNESYIAFVVMLILLS